MSEGFDEAITNFALAFADQAKRNHAALKSAEKNGRIQAWRA
jgi:hypothetical protein